MEEIKLGCEAKDKITGFQGIVTGRSTYLFGCDNILLSPKSGKDNTYKDGHWFDEPRIEYIGKGILAKEVQGKKPGGDLPAPLK